MQSLGGGFRLCQVVGLSWFTGYPGKRLAWALPIIRKPVTIIVS